LTHTVGKHQLLQSEFAREFFSTFARLPPKTSAARAPSLATDLEHPGRNVLEKKNEERIARNEKRNRQERD